MAWRRVRWMHRLRGRGVRGGRLRQRQLGMRVTRRGDGGGGRSGKLASVGGILGAVAREVGTDLPHDHIQVGVQVPSPWSPARPARHAPRQGALPRSLLLPLAASTAHSFLSRPGEKESEQPDSGRVEGFFLEPGCCQEALGGRLGERFRAWGSYPAAFIVRASNPPLPLPQRSRTIQTLTWVSTFCPFQALHKLTHWVCGTNPSTLEHTQTISNPIHKPFQIQFLNVAGSVRSISSTEDGGAQGQEAQEAQAQEGAPPLDSRPCSPRDESSAFSASLELFSNAIPGQTALKSMRMEDGPGNGPSRKEFPIAASPVPVASTCSGGSAAYSRHWDQGWALSALSEGGGILRLCC